MKRTHVLVSAMLTATLLPGGPVKNPSQTFETLVPAIQAGDDAAVAALLDRGADVNGRAADGSTPLMTAALYSNASMMRLLLDRGADPNASANSGGTALMWGIGDIRKVRLLLERGADVKARTKSGRTAMHVAAMIDGGFDTVKTLAAKGAEIDAKDENGATPLIEAGGALDTRTVRFFLEGKAEVNAKDRAGRTPLVASVMNGSLASAKLLLTHGADPNNGGVFGVPAIMLAIIGDNTDLFRLLASKGAALQARDSAENTTLIWAASSEVGNTRIVSDLLKAGIDVNAKNKLGHSALDTAKRRGNTPVTAVLRSAGAMDESKPGPSMTVERDRPPTPQVAVERALAVLQKGAAGFTKKAACSSCHNQTLPAMAAAAARERGITGDRQHVHDQLTFVKKSFSPGADKLLEGVEFIPDIPITGSYTLLGLSADRYEPDKMTTAAAQHIAFRQLSDGRWSTFAPRPPMEYSDFTATALSLRALQLYGPQGRAPEFRARIEKARKWIRKAQPKSTEEYSMKLMGLIWSKGQPSDIQRVARLLLARQRKDGGWAQISSLPSDAYATGQALTALKMAGDIYGSNDAYERGVGYLLRTQHEDGSWMVESRAFPFQPYFDSGFPHGHNQWISSAATAWSAMAILGSIHSAAETQVAVSRKAGQNR